MCSFSVAGSKHGLKALFLALPPPSCLCGPQARLAVWPSVHLAIHTPQ